MESLTSFFQKEKRAEWLLIFWWSSGRQSALSWDLSASTWPLALVTVSSVFEMQGDEVSVLTCRENEFLITSANLRTA